MPRVKRPTITHVTDRRIAGVLLLLAAGLYPLACSEDKNGGPDGQGGGPLGTSHTDTDPTAGGGPIDPTPETLRLLFEKISVPSNGEGAVDFRFVPGQTDKIVMLTREAHLVYFQLQGTSSKKLKQWTVPDDLLMENACVPANVLFDPHYDENGFVYLSYCNNATDTRIARYQLSLSSGFSDLQVILETDGGGTWHRFGSMDFEEDGETLWVQVGDHTDRFNGQNIENVKGALLRIVPSRKPGLGGYEPASGNMIDLYEADGGMGGTTATWETEPAPELYAYGLRSPFRGTRDQLGRFWIGDVGEDKFEEVNLVSQVGQNLGWKHFEGPCEEDCDGFVNPVAFYGRGDHPYADEDPATNPATKRTIWVGEIYENPTTDRYSQLMDHVVPFGDLFTGWVRGLKADESDQLTMDQFLGHLEGVVSWRVGPDGYAYALSLDGDLYRALLDPQAN